MDSQGPAAGSQSGHLVGGTCTRRAPGGLWRDMRLQNLVATPASKERGTFPPPGRVGLQDKFG